MHSGMLGHQVTNRPNHLQGGFTSTRPGETLYYEVADVSKNPGKAEVVAAAAVFIRGNSGVVASYWQKFGPTAQSDSKAAFQALCGALINKCVDVLYVGIPPRDIYMKNQWQMRDFVNDDTGSGYHLLEEVGAIPDQGLLGWTWLRRATTPLPRENQRRVRALNNPQTYSDYAG